MGRRDGLTAARGRDSDRPVMCDQRMALMADPGLARADRWHL